MVAEWTQSEGYCDTGIRTDTYAEAETKAARLHQTYGQHTRYLPLPLVHGIELGAVWGGAR